MWQHRIKIQGILIINKFLEIPVKKKKKNVVLYRQKKEFDKQLRFLKNQTKNIESEITKIENEIKIFNALLSEVNKKGNINKQIDYNDYNRLNDLLNIQLDNWEKNQNELNKITKDKSKKKQPT